MSSLFPPFKLLVLLLNKLGAFPNIELPLLLEVFPKRLFENTEFVGLVWPNKFPEKIFWFVLFSLALI